MFITVFTSTYNRADLLERVFSSLSSQDFKSFEWVLIDDGSNDNTHSVISVFQETAKFPIKYLKNDVNKGKVASINIALEIAKGEFFLVFDSDDWCVDGAFSRFNSEWNCLTLAQRKEYSGISFLKAFRDGKIVGENYERMAKLSESYIDRFNRRIRGDKWEFIRTDLHREARYDLAFGERYMAPEYAWLKLAKNYKTIFLNEVLSIIEYQETGISRNNLWHRVNSPKSCTVFYEVAFGVSRGVANRVRALSNYVRFCMHARIKIAISSFLLIFAFPFGYLLYRLDSRKMDKI